MNIYTISVQQTHFRVKASSYHTAVSRLACELERRKSIYSAIHLVTIMVLHNNDLTKPSIQEVYLEVRE